MTTAALLAVRIETRLADPLADHQVLEARVRGALAGYLSYHFVWTDEAGDVTVVDMIETNPEFARQGVARALLENLTVGVNRGELPVALHFTVDGALFWRIVTGRTVTISARSNRPRERNWVDAQL